MGRYTVYLSSSCSWVRSSITISSLWVQSWYATGRRASTLGHGAIPPNIGPLKASANRCKERSVTFKIRQNAFPAGTLPRTPRRNSRYPPDLLVSWGGDTRSHTPPTRHLQRLDSLVFGDRLSVPWLGGHCTQIFFSRTTPTNRLLSCNVNSQAHPLSCLSVLSNRHILDGSTYDN